MELLLLLLAAHFIGDFYLQPLQRVECRYQNHFKSPGLWKHFGVHLALYVVVFVIAPIAVVKALVAVAVLAFAHLITDYWKSYRRPILRYFLIDQVIHIATIGAVCLWLAEVNLADIKAFLMGMLSSQNIAIALAYLLVGKPASVFIAMALKRHTESLKPALESSAQQQDNKAVGLASAGAWIGYIERFLTLSFVLMGQFTGIGFLVATKTIFRFGDLTNSKDMKLTEYMMLGTLLSFAIALSVGWVAARILLA